MNKKVVIISLIAFFLLTFGSKFIHTNNESIFNGIKLQFINNPPIDVEPNPLGGEDCFCGATLCGDCSDTNIGYYCPIYGGGLVANCNLCGCPGADDVCQEDGACTSNTAGNINVHSDEGSSGLLTIHSDCSDGTAHGECSESVEWAGYICNDGTLISDCGECGSYCYVPEGTSLEQVCQNPEGCLAGALANHVCFDGTVDGECSLTQPFYCSGDTLIADCTLCGCSGGESCDHQTKICTPSCEEGTLYDECSLFRPFFCDSGNLIKKCSLCGCDDNKICNANTEECYVPNRVQRLNNFKNIIGLDDNEMALVGEAFLNVNEKPDVPERERGPRKPIIEYDPKNREIKISILDTQINLYRNNITRKPIIDLNFGFK